MQREDEDEKMIRNGLKVAVKWMKRMRSEGGWNYDKWFREGRDRD
jgi:hypothetical protein